METVRLRLVFEDRNILSKNQKKEGLKRSWILLKSQHQTISDLSSYILHIFHLHDSCHHGLILSMDGFVLPPFESTCIFKDKDMICVEKKGGSSTEIIKVRDGVNSLEVDIVEKSPVVTSVKLLATEEFDKETGGYESESEDDERQCEEKQFEDWLQVKNAPIGVCCESEPEGDDPGADDKQLKDAVVVKNTPNGKVSRKRKAPEMPSSSKRKKSKVSVSEKSPAVPKDVEKAVNQEKDRTSRHGNVLTKKQVIKKDKSFVVEEESEMSRSSESDERSNDASKVATNRERCSQLQENGKVSLDASHTSAGVKKLPSRSARRKKAKRQWLREQAKIEKEKFQQKQLLEKDNQQSTTEENIKVPEEHKHSSQNSDAEDVVVPVVVRPGYIRFEPLEEVDEDQVPQKNQISVENFQWNGINSKKKGQKWGREKTSSLKRKGHINISQTCFEMESIEEEVHVNDQMDFDKLMSYSSLPKEGDVVAYRLIELSSSWTPEISSFRVGKISLYNAESNRVMLMPVAEYRIPSQTMTDEEASGLQPETSLYGEDGSLEIDYSSLVDVRLVKRANPSSAKPVASRVDENCEQEHDAVTSMRPNNSKEATPAKENGKLGAWEEISQVLNAKKAELSKEDGSQTKNSSRSPWSYRALRGSALGPTMALLRAQNEI